MRVAILAEFNEPLSEGMAISAARLQAELAAQGVGAERVHIPGLRTGPGRRGLRKLSPDILHWVPGVTPLSPVALRALSLMYPRAKTIISAIRGPPSPKAMRRLRLLPPDGAIAPSRKVAEQLQAAGLDAVVVPPGVDTRRFVPVGASERESIRTQLGVAPHERLVSHVGHIKGGRNVEAIARSLSKGVKLLVVGSPTTGPEQATVGRLQEMGAMVISDFVPDIERIYRASDAYLFPTQDLGHAISMPLSVLEAMACGVPVLSTHFGVLEEWLPDGDGIRYFDRPEDFDLDATSRLKRSPRDAVLAFDWKEVARTVAGYYGAVMSSS